MTTHLRIFYALLWKEFREAWFFWLATIIFTLLITNLLEFVWKSERLQLIHRGNPFALIFGANPIAFIFLVCFMLFLPLLSRESERGTLPILTMKPISPELFALYNWSVTTLLAMAPVSLFLFLFLLKQNAVNLPVYADGLKGSVDVGYLDWWPLLLSLFPISLLIYWVSSATSNRFRSFGLLLIGGFVLVVAGEYLTFRLGLFTEPNLITQIDYFFHIHPIFGYAIVSLLLFLTTALLLRLRMTHTLVNWVYYLIPFTTLLILFFLTLYFNVRNINSAQLAIDPTLQQSKLTLELVYKEGITTGMDVGSNDNGGQILADRKLSMPWKTDERLYRVNIIGKNHIWGGNYSTWVNNWVQNTTETVKLVIEKNPLKLGIKGNRWQTVYKKEMQELFNADSMKNRVYYERYNPWINVYPWGAVLSETVGLVGNKFDFSYNLIEEYCKTSGVKPETFRVINNPIHEMSLSELNQFQEGEFEKYLNERFVQFRQFIKEYANEDVSLNENFNPTRKVDFRLMGRFTLEDEPKFTLIEAMDIDLLTENGRKQYTVQAAEPGVFEPTTFNQFIIENPEVKIGNIVGDHFTPSFPFQSFKQTSNNGLERLVNTSYMTHWLFLSNYLNYNPYEGPEPHQSGSRFFRVLTSGVDFDTNPTLACYDLSNPTRVTLYLGGQLLRDFPRPKTYNEYRFAVSGNYLVLSLIREDVGILSLFDISDPQNMREIDRIENIRNFHWINWPLRHLSGYGISGVISLIENDKAILVNSKVIAIYQIQPEGRLHAYARIVYPNTVKNIKQYAFRDKELWLLIDDDSLLRYAIGPTSEEPGRNKEPVYLQDTKEYKDVYKEFISETRQ